MLKKLRRSGLFIGNDQSQEFERSRRDLFVEWNSKPKLLSAVEPAPLCGVRPDC